MEPGNDKVMRRSNETGLVMHAPFRVAESHEQDVGKDQIPCPLTPSPTYTSTVSFASDNAA
jgi:hypothetical protein